MKVKEICEYGIKSKVKAGEGLTEGKYKFFTSSAEANKFVNEYQFDKPGIIMGTGGNATLHYCDTPFSVSTDCIVLFPKDKLITKYLYYFFRGNFHILENGFKGAGLKHTSKKYINEIKIKKIPIQAKQEQIIDVLDNIEDIITRKKQQLLEYDQLIKSRFVEMFGNPIKNDKEWKLKFLDEVCDVRDGTHDSPKYYNVGYPLITSKNISNGNIDYSTAQLICEEDYQNINKRSKVDNGDILMPMIGTVGGAIIVRKERDFAIKNVALIKFNTKLVENTFIKYVLNSDQMNLHFEDLKKGGTQKFIGLKTIRNLPIIVPPIKLQSQFATFVQQVDKLKFEVLKLLRELR